MCCANKYWALKMHPVSEQSRHFHRRRLFSLHAPDTLHFSGEIHTLDATEYI